MMTAVIEQDFTLVRCDALRQRDSRTALKEQNKKNEQLEVGHRRTVVLIQ